MNSNDEDVVAQLAETLVRVGIPRGQLGRIDADNLAWILLPIVRRYGNQRAAEALTIAAEDWRKPESPHRPVNGWLLARAAALRGEVTR